MSTATPSITVFIWYPGGGGCGHCSCYIGDITVAMSANPLFNLDERRKRSMKINRNHNSDAQLRNELPTDPNYVSWWPDTSAGVNPISIMFCRQRSLAVADLHLDIEKEKKNPHVIYTLCGLNVAAMQHKWQLIKNKYEHVGETTTSYRFGGKNCAEIVKRVLIAGGINDLISSKTKRYWCTHSGIWTPKKVAQMCDAIGSEYRKKVKASHCPTKSSLAFECMIGLR